MTAEELTALSRSELVDLVLQKQDTIAQLQAQLAELETQARLTRRIVTASAADEFVSLTSPAGTRKHHRHHHRPWYKRIWHSMLPNNLHKRAYVLIILLMIVLSLLVGAAISYQANNRSANNQSSHLITINVSLA